MKLTTKKTLNTVSDLELLPILVALKNTIYLIVLLYRPPTSSIPLFLQSLQIELDQLRQQIDSINYSIVILGDFNLPDNRNDLNEVLPPNIYYQRCQDPTHIDGNTLDLIFDDHCNKPAEWMPSPYSDHFTVFVDLALDD